MDKASRLAAPARRPSVMVAGALLIALLIGPTVAWSAHLVDVVIHCKDGLGNHGVSGHLSGWHCVLDVRGVGQLRLPLQSDAVIVAGLATAFAAAVGALIAGRRWSFLTGVPPVVLLVVGLPMGLRAWQERAMDRMSTMYLEPSAPSFGLGGSEDGWTFSTRAGPVLIPEPSGAWFGVAFVAGLASLGLLAIVLARRRDGARLDGSGAAGLAAPAGDLGQQNPGGHGRVQ